MQFATVVTAPTVVPGVQWHPWGVTGLLADGDTWEQAVRARWTPGRRPWGVYVHVPYCRVRCGYCDFNTYTAAELSPEVSQATYADQLIGEIRRTREFLAGTDRPIDTVFFGGGTPTLLPAADLVAVLASLADTFGLAEDAEVTTEANPESVDRNYLDQLRSGGFTRLSLGMQSSSPSVLATLERTHAPGRAGHVVAAAREAGFEHVSVDLIYGTPGESAAEWRNSLYEAIGTGADHVSAYALTVEPGTAMGRRVLSGDLSAPDDDVAAARYEAASELLCSAGFAWYEVSNFARAGGVCHHNLGYWRGADWWGFGPGAHSHLDGLRWWTTKHPRPYAESLSAGGFPVAGWEVVDSAGRRLERLMLGLRLAEGLPLSRATATKTERRQPYYADLPPGPVSELVSRGLLDSGAAATGRAVLTLRGRLLADRVVVELADKLD